jgi:hypothetical protein
MEIALRERGVRRYSAGKCNPRIAEYNQCTQLAGYDDKIAWCSSILNRCLKQSGIRIDGGRWIFACTKWICCSYDNVRGLQD